MANVTPDEYHYEPSVVLPPGDTLAEILGEANMTQTELAARTGLSTKHINQIVHGFAPISSETALLLERATGVAARVWNNLEVAFREHESRQQEGARLATDLPWLTELPVNELIRRGWIEDGGTPIERLRSVCQFFGVANRSAWNAIWHKPTAYRTSRAFNSDPGAVAVWLRIGEIRANSIGCAPFDRAGLMAWLHEVRTLTQERDPDAWWPKLVSGSAEVGVVVLAEPEIKGACINGAARWLAPDKAMIQLSLRHRWNDIFWFTFFHEVGHLVLHSKKDSFINDIGAHSGVEQEADGFAAGMLVPRRNEADLAQLRTSTEVLEFARTLGIAPGIVVGRLQHDKSWPFSRGNELKQRFTFSAYRSFDRPIPA